MTGNGLLTALLPRNEGPGLGAQQAGLDLAAGRTAALARVLVGTAGARMVHRPACRWVPDAHRDRDGRIAAGSTAADQRVAPAVVVAFRRGDRVGQQVAVIDRCIQRERLVFEDVEASSRMLRRLYLYDSA